MNKLSRRMKRLLAIVLVEAIVAANVVTSYANEAYEPFTMTEQEAAEEAGDESYQEESYQEESYEESYEDSYEEESYEESYEETVEIPAVIPQDSASDEEGASDETLEEELLCICTEECTLEEYNKECPVCKEIEDEELDTDEAKEAFLLKKCLIAKENAKKVAAQVPTEIPQQEEEPTATPADATPDKLATASPEASETPEAAVTPSASVTPEASETPDVSASPDADEAADASASPNADEEAVVSASPEVDEEADASASPSPEASESPSPAAGLTGVVIEKEEGLSGSVEQRASRMIFSKQVNMDYTVTVRNTSEEAASNVEVTAEIPSIITVGSVSGGSVSDGTVTWTIDEIGAGKTATLTAKGYVNENTDNVDNLNGRFYINGTKIEDVDFSGEWRLLEADDEEGPTYISTVVDGVTISVSAADGSILPSGVSVKATRVSVADAIEALEAEHGIDVLDAIAFDVVLIVNGEEVQPDGSVVVSFHDVPLAYEAGGEVGVAHMADNDTVEDLSEGGSLQDVSIETTHFSVYVVYSTKISGTYSPSNGVTTSDGESMACFDFHIFANYYDSEYGGHVNGNFAIRNIEGEVVSSFGLNNGDKVDNNKKVFYVEHLTAWNSALSTYKDSIFIFGPAITLEVSGNDDPVYAIENGKKIEIGYYRDLKDRIFTTDSSYIDFEEEFRKAAAYSEELSGRQNTKDATVDTADNGDKTIKGTGDEIVISMTGEELATANQRQMVFNASKAGQKFIINVTLTASSYSFTSNGMFYKLNGKDLSNSEDNAFSSGSILWNFINPDGTPYTGTITIENNWLGTVFAPRATVNFGVVNGSVVADRVHKLQGESHKGDYNSNKISYTVTKKWGEDGKATHDDIEVSLYRRIRLQSGAFADGGVLDRANIGDTTKYEWIRDGVISCSTGATSITFSDLPSSDEYGYTCDYFIVEKNVPSGYEASYEGNNVVVNEPTFTPGPTLARLTLTAQKTLEGAYLTAGQFTFVLTGDGIQGEMEASNDIKGNISWGEIVYEQAGTYTYTITEKSGDADNVTYDDAVYTVTVVVVADEAGNLSVESITYTRDGNPADGVAFTNTYIYSAEGDAVIEAFKTLNGKTPGINVFTFILEDENHHEIARTVNDGYGNITFKDVDALHYTQDDIGKTFTYYVREMNEGKAGYVYSEAVYEVKITVVDNGNGTLSVVPKYEGGNRPAFDNEYDAKGELQLNAVKVLKNGELTDGAFSFTLTETDANGKVTVHNVTNAADGTLNLPEFEYGLEDIARSPITYELAEVDGKNPNIVYDKAVYKVVVTLTDDGQGNILVSTTGEVDSFTFINTNLTDVEAKIQAHKTLNGTDPGDKTFWFVLIDESGTEIKRVQNSGRDIDFGNFKYTAADLGKTYTYTIKEVVEDKAGYVFDGKEYTVTVTITDDDQDGQLEAKVLYNDSETIPTFTNTYTAEGDVTIRATKILNGDRALEAGQFTFELWDVTNEPATKVDEAKNASDGSITFKTITYKLSDAGKTFTYEVREVQGAAGSGYTYDSTVYTVKVTVTDEGTGKLVVTPVYVEGEAIFNNYYEAEGSTHFEAQKELSGRALADGQFSFELYEKNGEELKLLQTKQNSGKGIVFDEIEYKKAGVYTYVIKEVIGNEAGYTYDSTEYEVTVTVTDNGDGTLKVETEYEGGDKPTFSNSYEATGQMTPGAIKTLNGKAPADGQFSFELRDAAGSVLQTRTNAADGSISFDEIKYTQEDIGKIFTYTIHEVQGAADSGYTYDQTIYTVTVEVKDKGDGTLEAIPVYSRNGETVGGATFANTYNANGSIVLTATKVLSGRTLADKQFSFILEGEGISQTVYNDGSGNITFEALNYTLDDVGEHKYTLREVVETKEGYTFDVTVYEVVVTVTDAGNGQLTVTATYNGSTTAPTFSNEYKATGQMTPEASKTLTGRKLEEGQFTFVLKDAAGNVLQTKTNAADGKVIFDEIKYTQEDAGKTYTYTITESVTDPVSGYEYDSKEYTITVEVTDNGNGELTAIPVYSLNDQTVGGAAFVNTYSADGSIVLKATKVLEGRKLEANQFYYELKDADGNVLQTVQNDEGGNITFKALEYGLEDVGNTYTYTISEVIETKDGYRYDDKVYEVEVTVSDNGDGTLDISVKYVNGTPVFTNYYGAEGEMPLEAKKVLIGRELEAEQFSFVLKDASGNVLQTVSNDGNGKISFEAIKYTTSDIGKEYTYTISEVIVTKDGYTYDTTVYTVTVVVNDNGDGTISAEPVYTDAIGGAVEVPTFTNYYDAEGEAVLRAQKTLEGSALQDGQFTFILEDEAGNEIERVTNLGTAVTFTALQYTLEDAGKTFTYYVRELADNQDGYYYDEARHKVTVEVTDDGNGTLLTVVKYDDSDAIPVFKNSYDAEGEFTLTANKTLTGRPLEEGQFSFELVDAAGNVIQTVTNAADGSITFETIKYTISDVANSPITYTVREKSGDAEGYTYDGTVYTVIVTLADNGDGTIQVTTEYVGVESINFTNTYAAEGEAVLRAQKTLEGGTLTDGQFSFELRDEEGNILQVKQNDAGGAVVFDPISYTLEDDGRTFNYTIREVIETAEGYIYDETVHNVTVTVSDSGTGRLEIVITYDSGEATFVNRYTSTPTPTPTPGTTPGPEETPTPGDEPAPTPNTTTGPTPTPTPSGDVLGARRTQIGGTDAAVLGARRGSDFAVLGKRRRPSTGDSIAMVMWILAMMAAAGGAITSLIMMRYSKKKGE